MPRQRTQNERRARNSANNLPLVALFLLGRATVWQSARNGSRLPDDFIADEQAVRGLLVEASAPLAGVWNRRVIHPAICDRVNEGGS
jgi:hypothetical protein